MPLRVTRTYRCPRIVARGGGTGDILFTVFLCATYLRSSMLCPVISCLSRIRISTYLSPAFLGLPQSARTFIRYIASPHISQSRDRHSVIPLCMVFVVLRTPWRPTPGAPRLRDVVTAAALALQLSVLNNCTY
eukprot:6203978-Pleurochrysis_carterae.AAC.1